MSTHHILGLKKGELRGANPSTRGLGWANLWCTGCYANSSAGQLSWYGRTAAPREILLYTSSRTRFLNRTSIGERCKHREDWSLCVTTSHLSYTFDQGCRCEAIVKVHGVLPSSRWYSASSRRIQFHRVHVGDSGAVVTPFVQVATYATRNFATLGQLELLPPFTGA
ncbi:hypothetical protein CRG98_046318 [Punica granatum]|uniref:Uncharacterized protein n=1 Tax=Punica granatum TaxID=22663 RepID=A0A2I0HNM3_PUNGR|nr:hypothetical protein CRG98_046318 [Punica granatum]